MLSASADVPRFAVLARTISEKGTLPGIQLATAPAWLEPSRTWKPLDVGAELSRLRSRILKLDADAINQALDRFSTSAALAVQAGFRVIEIHAAHGYLLSLLLSSIINQRRDIFRVDGDWLDRFCQSLRSAVGNHLLAVRISATTGAAPLTQEIEGSIALGKRLCELGVDILDVSAGFYTYSRHLIYPHYRDESPASAIGPGIEIAQALSQPVIVAGNIRTLDSLAACPSNVLFAIGRSMLADPEIVQKLLSGRAEQIIPCCSTGRCHFFTRGRTMIECGQNPRLALNGE